VDKWAQSEFAQPSGTKVDHCLSPSEINHFFKNYLEEKSTNHLKTCQKTCIQAMPKTGQTNYSTRRI
jgi:hypothetical protein